MAALRVLPLGESFCRCIVWDRCVFVQEIVPGEVLYEFENRFEHFEKKIELILITFYNNFFTLYNLSFKVYNCT